MVHGALIGLIFFHPAEHRLQWRKLTLYTVWLLEAAESVDANIPGLSCLLNIPHTLPVGFGAWRLSAPRLEYFVAIEGVIRFADAAGAA